MYYIMRQLRDSYDVYHSICVISFKDKQGWEFILFLLLTWSVLKFWWEIIELKIYWENVCTYSIFGCETNLVRNT